MGEEFGRVWDLYTGRLDSETSHYELAKETLIERFRFLYENSGLILAQILYEFQTNKPFCEEISHDTGLCVGDENVLRRNFNYDSFDILHLVEEYLFGRYCIKKFYFSERTELEMLISDSLVYNSDLLKKIRNEYNYCDSRVGINKKDIATLCILEILLSAILSQKEDYTSIIERSRDNEFKAYSSIVVEENDKRLSSSNKELKAVVLSQYFKLCKYRNSSIEKVPPLLSNFKIPSFKKNTLVTDNKFLTTFYSLASMVSNDDAKKLYFLNHDEIPWDLKVRCHPLNNPILSGEKTSCNEDFPLKEEDIYYIKDSFYQLCPHCGCLVEVERLITNSAVRRRIEHRSYGDENLLNKINLLSELISLDGMDQAKKLLKQREES